MTNHVPLRITVRLAAPVAMNFPWVMLDSALEYLAQKRVLGADFWNHSSIVFRDYPRRLAEYAQCLAYWNGVPCCSVGQFGTHKIGTARFYKRTHLDDFPAPKVQLDGFTFKNCQKRVIYAAAETVTFYARGDFAMLSDLLRDLTHIGSMTNHGWGEVGSCVVEPCREDWALIREGMAMRPIPSKLVSSASDVAGLKWRPPYWSGAPELCAVPGSEVSLG